VAASFFDANLSLDCMSVGWGGGLRGWGRFCSLPVIAGGLPAGESVAVTWSLSVVSRVRRSPSYKSLYIGDTLATATTSTASTTVNAPP